VKARLSGWAARRAASPAASRRGHGRYQEWRDDLDVEIALEQIKLGTYRRTSLPVFVRGAEFSGGHN